MIYDKNSYRKVVALIAAGGSGKRMGTEISKQYLELKGKPIIAWTIEVFEKSEIIDEIIIIAKEEDQTIREIIDKYSFKKIKTIAEGGRERQNSIFNGLKAIDDPEAVVVIHDGVRPFIKPKQINELINKALSWDGVAIGVEVKDTIKVIERDNTIKETLERKCLRAIQTPQVFRYDIIYPAHQQAIDDNYIGTDDCSLVERLGKRVLVLEGDYDNIKITTPEDLYIGEGILENLK